MSQLKLGPTMQRDASHRAGGRRSRGRQRSFDSPAMAERLRSLPATLLRAGRMTMMVELSFIAQSHHGFDPPAPSTGFGGRAQESGKVEILRLARNGGQAPLAQDDDAG
ncbi:MAG TPA: hypothetical protein VGS15_03615 [Candidatus Acidoferrales bacterium]|nr:hypothetical protein [Candidatus Acidoferrales bacterium]